jgi:two-component system chemotaxis sensor kinase CheA
MDDLLREFLTETNESLDTVDVELVRFEQEPNNAQILGNIFRLVHTIKGTCGFLNLPRLEALTHAAEAMMGKFRDGMPVTGEAVSLILSTIDRVKDLLDELERHQAEPVGDDGDLIRQLHHMANAGSAPARPAEPEVTTGSLVYQVLERPLRPGEVPLDELERVFRETSGPEPGKTAPVSTPQSSAAPAAAGEDKGEISADDERPESKVARQSIRVQVDTLENLMTMVSELVLTRNQLLEIVRRHEDSEFKAPLQQLSNVTAELQESIMKTRMQPIGVAWQKLPRIVRDLAGELGKSIELELHGAETELDRQVLDFIKDPLLHMVRNSADHGLELPQERRAAGKPDKGTIRLSAYHEGGQIVIEIADDGRGLDVERIKARALANGLASEADLEKLSDAQINKFIFTPGFSTASTVTSISGRGVGMDVVRSNIDQIGGTIDVQSVAGRGTSITIKIPLTLAIIAALIIECAGDRFAIPQLAVAELVRVRAGAEHRIERIKNAAVLRLRDKLLPLVDLRKLLKIDDGQRGDVEGDFIVVVQVGNETFGVVVDAVFHTEEIVVKPLSSRLSHITMFSGNTILGDGSVIMIIDPNGVAEALGTTALRVDKALGRDEAAGEEQRQTESILLFRAGSAQPKAVPISLVTRLEVIGASTIETSGDRQFVQYRGQLMPLIPAAADMARREQGTQPLLVFSDEGRSMGLLVDEIVDIVEDNLTIEVKSERPGVLGSAVIKGQATEVLDIGHYLPLAYHDWFEWKDRVPGTGREVLLVDDAAFFRHMLAPVLGAAGYSVTTAASAAEALTLVRRGRRFDAVVTDIEMPEMNGFELAEKLRDEPRGGVPVIGLTALVSAEAVERGRRAGLHDFVAKFDRRGLLAALKEQTADISRAA